ncbi:MAG: zinc metallopeptidase [Clostridiales bacterium]|nr:zinc metallopeptidase [Clostridiales bacterium]
MYFDYTYLILVLPAVILAMIASSRVHSVFRRYQQQHSRRGITGAAAARAVLDANGLQEVRIEHISGELTDHYDPRDHVIRLSDSVYGSTSTAAIGVAAHEAGHAVQYAVGYTPIRIRAAIIPATNIGSKLAMPLVILGLILSYYGQTYLSIAYIGIVCFALATVFQLVTLPTEFNASRRALAAISAGGLLDSDEMEGARKTLSAAAMTYVAALAVSLVQLLRLLLIVASHSRRN